MKLKDEIKESSFKARRIVVSFLSILTATVVVFLAHLTLNIQSDLKEMKHELAAIKEITQKQPLPKMISAPFAVLEDTCSRCHNQQKFMGMQKTPYEIRRVIESMESHAVLDLSGKKQEQVYASLLLLRCAGCHTEGQIADFGNWPTNDLAMITQKKNIHAQAGIYRQDIEETLRVYTAIKNY